MKAKALPWVLPILLAAGPVLAAAGPADGLLRSLGEPKRLSSAMETVVVLTILSLIPTVLILTTCFLRFSLVLGFARQALSLQQTPPNHVLISLAMVLTFFVMGSTLKTINDTAVQPYRQGKLAFETALEKGAQPLREFLLKQTRRRELSLAVRLARLEPKTEADVPFHVLTTAYVLSELKTAFQMGFLLFIPFLVIDLGVSSVLMSLGMMMVPPNMVALPLKLLLFVMVDGWSLLVQGLVESVR